MPSGCAASAPPSVCTAPSATSPVLCSPLLLLIMPIRLLGGKLPLCVSRTAVGLAERGSLLASRCIACCLPPALAVARARKLWQTFYPRTLRHDINCPQILHTACILLHQALFTFFKLFRSTPAFPVIEHSTSLTHTYTRLDGSAAPPDGPKRRSIEVRLVAFF